MVLFSLSNEFQRDGIPATVFKKPAVTVLRTFKFYLTTAAEIS
jgi:hypothetical protein